MKINQFYLPNNLKLTIRNVGNCYTPKRSLGKKQQKDLEVIWSAASLLGNTQTKRKQRAETPPTPLKKNFFGKNILAFKSNLDA